MSEIDLQKYKNLPTWQPDASIFFNFAAFFAHFAKPPSQKCLLKIVPPLICFF